jgi:hypothetical protein
MNGHDGARRSLIPSSIYAAAVLSFSPPPLRFCTLFASSENATRILFQKINSWAV